MALSAQDIQRLRQQSRDGIPPDIMSGIISSSMEQNNPIDVLRRQSTGPTFPNGGIIPRDDTPAPSPSPSSNPLEEFNPDFTDRDRLRRLMDSVPERTAPSFARSLVASALSTKAEDPVKTAESVMQAPYLRNMASWKEKTEPFYKTAELENRSNINERNIATSAMTARTAADRLAEQGRQADQKNEVAAKNAESTRIRSLAYAYHNSGWEIKVAGNRIIAAKPPSAENPNGAYQDLGDSGMMDQRELEVLKGQNAVNTSYARGEAATRTAQATAAVNNRDLIRIGDETYQRVPNAKSGEEFGSTNLPKGVPERVGTPSSGGTGAKTNQLETNRIKNERLGQAYQTDPIGKQYVKRISEGKYDFKPRPILGSTQGGYGFGIGGTKVTQEDLDQYDEFRTEIDPSYKPPKTSGVGPSNTAPPVEKPLTQGLGPSGRASGSGPVGRASNSSRVKVKDPKTGRTGTIPNDQQSIEAAVKQGLRVEVGN